MFFAEEEEAGLTAIDIQELSSLLQSSNSSEGSSRAVYSIDERKKRRKLSNRESARRSRYRKKRHIENLTEQLNRLRVENRDLKFRLDFVLNQCDHFWKENVELSSEYVALSTRLANLYQILGSMQMQQQPQ